MALKRNSELMDYSREHHYELLLVWKIREGLRKDIPRKRIIDYCTHHFNEVSSIHMAKEEKYILKKLPVNYPGRNKILEEHADINATVKNLSKDLFDRNDLLSYFADKLEKHVRYEERTFFPKLQKDFSDEIIKSMKPSEKREQDITDWKDPFWEK